MDAETTSGAVENVTTKLPESVPVIEGEMATGWTDQHIVPSWDDKQFTEDAGLELEADIELESQEGIDDPVRMYLREIGRV